MKPAVSEKETRTTTDSSEIDRAVHNCSVSFCSKPVLFVYQPNISIWIVRDNHSNANGRETADVLISPSESAWETYDRYCVASLRARDRPNRDRKIPL